MALCLFWLLFDNLVNNEIYFGMSFWFFGRNKAGTEKRLFRHKKLKIGLALGGGGARGVAHIGVLKAFEELGLEFDYVAGTSAGAVVGSLYSAGLTSLQIRDLALSLRTKDIKTSKLFFRPSKASSIADILKNVFGHDAQFYELRKPFVAVAVDLVCGNEKDLCEGSVASCVAGSCAVPGVFAPVVYEGMHLVDGGLKNNVPADVVRNMGADVVVAVDVNHKRGSGTSSTKLFNVIGSTIGVLMRDVVRAKLAFADIVLEPDVTKYPSTKLQNVDDMIKIGYDSVMNALPELSKLVSSKLSPRKKRKWKRKIQESM